MSDYFNVGPCCICKREGPSVRNLIAHNYEAPQENTGWGCVVCELRNDGAMSVICDQCLKLWQKDEAEIEFIIDGWPAEKKRMPIDQFEKVPFKHDEEKHAHLDGFIEGSK